VIGLLGSQCDMLGQRMATGINTPVIIDANDPTPTDGYLITDLNDNIVDSSGNKFIYVEF
jgi:hypothetical protein